MRWPRLASLCGEGQEIIQGRGTRRSSPCDVMPRLTAPTCSFAPLGLGEAFDGSDGPDGPDSPSVVFLSWVTAPGTCGRAGSRQLVRGPGVRGKGLRASCTCEIIRPGYSASLRGCPFWCTRQFLRQHPSTRPRLAASQPEHQTSQILHHPHTGRPQEASGPTGTGA